MNEVHIPTVGGTLNVLTISTPTDRVSTRYVASLSQSGVGNPPTVDNVFENSAQLTPTFFWTGAGQYILNSPNSFGGIFSNDKTIVTIGDVINNDFKVGTVRIDASNISIKTSFIDGAGIVEQDDILALTTIIIEQFGSVAPTTVETLFNYMLSQIDSTQTKIWTKIVVRFGGTVTEVDGDTYRRTSDFNNSSKLINS